MNVLFVESDSWKEYNSSYWRCIVPAKGLKLHGINSAVCRIEEWVERDPKSQSYVLSEASDLIIIQRNLFLDMMPEVFYWQTRGKSVVVDYDDAYSFMDDETGSPSVDFWKRSILKTDDGKETKLDPSPLDCIKRGSAVCGVVTAPSKLICDDWKDVAKVIHFPNYIDADLYNIKSHIFHPADKIFLFWGGSLTHMKSWQRSGAAEAVAKIMKEFKNVDIILVGDSRISKFINAPTGRKWVLGWSPNATFINRLSVADIGLAPFFGEYDRRRSWIKSLEYTTMGIPWIGSDMEPCWELQSTGRLVKNTVDEWYQAIHHYVTNYDGIKEIARSNIRIGEALTIQNNGYALEKLMEKLIAEAKL